MGKFLNTTFSLKQHANKLVEVISQQISRISPDKWQSVFFGVLFAYTATLVFVSVGYSSAARLFPLIIGVPLLGMILVNIALIYYPLENLSGSSGLFDNITEGVVSDQTNEDDSEETAAAARIHREITMTLWILGVLILTWLLGFLNAFAVFIFSFIYFHEGSLLRAGAVTLLALIFIYALFIELLSLPLWEGVLLGSVLIVKPIQGTTND